MPATLRLKLPSPWSNPAARADQERFLFCKKRIGLAATGIKVGKTLALAIWVILEAGKGNDRLVWWVAPYRRTAKIGFRRVKTLLGKFATANETELTITLPNGSRIEFRTAEIVDALFGEAVDALAIDEAARCREEAWNALQTTMAQTQGPIRLATNTDKGRRNWVYKLYIRGQDPEDPDVESFSIKTTEAPHITPAAIASFRRNLPWIRYSSLILAEFPEDAATVFAGLKNSIRPAFHYGQPPVLRRFDHTRGYVGGIDIGRHKNWSVQTILDRDSHDIVFWERMQKMPWAEQKAKMRRASEMYGDCLMIVDSTHGSAGDPIAEDLLLEGMPIQGFPFSSNMQKRALIEGLAVGIEQGDVGIPEQLTILRGELEAFEYEMTASGNVLYHAPDEEDAHDDCVISLALAYRGLGHAARTEYEVVEERAAIERGLAHSRGYGHDSGGRRR